MPKILIVEDDKDLALMIQEWLSADNFGLEVVHDGKAGWEFLRQGYYDAVVLDWELPGMSGVEILKKFRGIKGTTPILMLTGKGQIQDKEEGLDSGADDYLTKPFSMKELSARLRALMRRPRAIATSTIKIGDLEMDLTSHQVTKGGQALHILPKDYALLEFFMRNPNQVFSTEALLQRVWNVDSDAGSDALRTAIKRLRKLIDDNEDETSMIENIPKVGYRLNSK